ncbi:MAG: phage tail protein I, partial [Treponema sp.]|nr:phage tail protein I [Treponema sp.]
MDLSDVSIIPLLPPNLAKDKNIRAMCQAFDSELRRLIAGIPGIEIIPSLTRKQITDNLLLDLLAWQFHCDFYSPDMSSEIKQELILKSLDWHTRKGTPSVVEEIVSTVFSKAIILEWFEYGGLPYRFRIATDEQIPDTDGLSKFLHAIKSVKNVRSLLEDIIQLVYFIEELASFDTALYNYEREDIDFFEEKILRDGRVLRDGKTVFNKTVRVLRDGVFKRNGRHGRSGAYTFPGTDIMRLPLTRGSGYRDSLISTLKKPLADIQLGTLPRDGTRPRDGVLPRGWPTAFDTMPPFDLFN